MMDGFEFIDPRFRRFMLPNAPLERLADGFRWLEGPVWFAGMRCLLVSDIPNDRILRWTETGGVEVFRQPAGFPNGQTRDREGRLITCSHHGRCVLRTELDGELTVLADRFEGKRLNSPTTSSSSPTAPSGSLILPMAFRPTTRAASRTSSSRPGCTGSTRARVC
jgi:gluconolactonase